MIPFYCFLEADFKCWFTTLTIKVNIFSFFFSYFMAIVYLNKMVWFISQRRRGEATLNRVSAHWPVLILHLEIQVDSIWGLGNLLDYQYHI